MTPEEFVKGFHEERKSIIETYFDKKSETEVANRIAQLKLDDQGLTQMRQILHAVLRDAFYTVLLGLDGEANIGGQQISYQLQDEDGNELTGGEIESFAYEYFQQDND